MYEVSKDLFDHLMTKPKEYQSKELSLWSSMMDCEEQYEHAYNTKPEKLWSDRMLILAKQERKLWKRTKEWQKKK